MRRKTSRSSKASGGLSPSADVGSCSKKVNPQGTGCIANGVFNAFQNGEFLPDGKHVLAQVVFEGAPVAPNPASIYSGMQVIIFKTNGKKFSDGTLLLLVSVLEVLSERFACILTMFTLCLRNPPLVDLVGGILPATSRNSGVRRFFEPYLLDRFGDRGNYYGQRINGDNKGVPGSGTINDPEWNGMADPRWSPDSRQLVYWQTHTVSPACGGLNPLPCYKSK
ncbi:hypothetical protein ACHAPJ_009764 [Fusarium lateritium]